MFPESLTTPDILQKARARLLRMHFESGVGHIGGNLSCLDGMLLLWHEFIGKDDRFLLSKGHSAGALYISLWSRGLLPEALLKEFHRDGTLLAGHPPAVGIPEIIFSTGSLGHGLSLAAGTALAKRLKSAPGKTYCMMSDGEWQEGSTWEALIFACHHRLDNLTIIVDQNGLQGFGDTRSVASMAPLQERLTGFDLDLDSVCGHDLEVLRVVLNKPVTPGIPRLVIMNTVKGKGVSFMENRFEWHYLPLKADQFAQAMEELGTE